MGNMVSETDDTLSRSHSLCISTTNSPSCGITSSDQWSPITPNTPNLQPTSISKFPSNRLTKITKRVVSDRIFQTAAKFWCQNIDTCSMQDRLEIASSVWFGIISNSDMQKL
eukprot:51099_1